MSALRSVSNRARAVLGLGIVEIACGWLAASVVVRVATGNLESDPRGAGVLFGDGARGFLDQLRLEPTRALHALETALAGAFAWAVVSVLLSGALPSLFVRRPSVTMLDACGRSVRRSGILIVVALAALAGYVLLAIVAAASLWASWHATASWANVKHADFVGIVSLGPACAVAIVWGALRDLVVLRAMDDRAALGQTLRLAARDFVARPVSISLGAVGATLASLLALAGAASIVVPLERDRFGVALLAIAGQQALALVRIGIRATWFAHLARLLDRVISPGIPAQTDRA